MDATVRRIFKVPALERLLLALCESTGARWLLKLAPGHYSYAPGTRRVCRRNGIVFDADIATYNGWMLYYLRSENHKVASLAKPGEVVLDVGANIGEVALACAARVGTGGRVYAFEPNPPTFENLSRNVNLNASLPCHVENLALGERAGTIGLVQVDGRNPGTVTVAESGESRAKVAEIRVTTLDEYVTANNLPRVDLIKIDVEGYESQALRGATQTLARWHPRLVIEIVDSHQRRHGGSARELAAWLRTNGYSLTELSSGRVIGPDENLDGCQLDVLCT